MIKNWLIVIFTFIFTNLLFIFINVYKIFVNATIRLDIVTYLHYNFNFNVLPVRYILFSLLITFFVYLVLFASTMGIKRYLKTSVIFFVIIFCLVIACMFKTYDVYNYVFSNLQTSDFYEKNYVDIRKAKIDIPKHKKNLIMIYIESMENSFENRMFFKENLIPELSKIQEENISFAKYTNGYYQNNTQMSLVATMTGIPSKAIYLNDGIYIESLSKNIQRYLPNIYSLGEFLRDNGYCNLFVQSCNISFSGADKFLKQHGFDNCYGADEILSTQTDVDIMSKNGLGVQDKYTIEFFKKEILKCYKQNKPMCLVMATIDTHSYYYLKNDEKIKNIQYASKQIKLFIDWVNKQPFAKDTVIILLGDHLRTEDSLMTNYVGDRYIYNAFINCDNKNINKNRQFTQIDFFPTILEALGFKIEGSRLGLGTSLFSNRKTLIEELGEQELNKQLAKRNKLYNSFWKN